MTNNPATPRDAAPEFSGGGLTEPPGDWDEGVTGDPGEGEPEAEGGVAPVEGEGDEAEGEGDVAGLLLPLPTLMESFWPAEQCPGTPQI